MLVHSKVLAAALQDACLYIANAVAGTGGREKRKITDVLVVPIVASYVVCTGGSKRVVERNVMLAVALKPGKNINACCAEKKRRVSMAVLVLQNSFDQ